MKYILNFDYSSCAVIRVVNRSLSKTIVLKTTIFKNELLKKAIVFKTVISFSIFRRRFHNETIVLQKNENVNIPIYRLIIQ